MLVIRYTFATLLEVGFQVKSLSLLSFLIELDDGCTVRRHIDHIRVRGMTTTSVSDSDSDFLDLPDVQQPASSDLVQDDADAQEPPPSVKTSRSIHSKFRLDYLILERRCSV